jgi:hypothetical protein
VSPTVEKGVNLITSDATDIAAHLGTAFDSIPNMLKDYVVARIIHDRRHMKLEEAPLPRPEFPGRAESKFLLKQQQEFQNGWTSKFVELEKTFEQALTELTEKK